jgi:hypothetical protein
VVAAVAQIITHLDNLLRQDQAVQVVAAQVDLIIHHLLLQLELQEQQILVVVAVVPLMVLLAAQVALVL